MSESEEIAEILSSFQNLKQTKEEPAPPPLVNRPKPVWVNSKESPQQRLAIELAAKGLNAKEIAAKIGQHPVTVRNTLKQPMLQDHLVRSIRRTAERIDEQVSEIFNQGVVEGAQLLLDTVRNEKDKKSDRIVASQEFLNRRYGKPNQPVNRGTDVDLNLLSVAEIVAEMEAKN